MSHIDFTLWPNAGGTLGQNKVAIPDGVTVQWPDGDALEGNFIYKNGLLSGFVDTKALIANNSNSTTFPYDYVNIEVDKSLKGVMNFNRGPRTKYFTVTYSGSGNSGVVTLKYKGCKTLDDVIAVDPNYLTNDIVDGVWSEGLGDLTNGTEMFVASSIISFNSDLSSLTNGYGMFTHTDITNFNSNLSSLIDGNTMFNSCDYLTIFNADLSSMTTAYFMFEYCALTSFTSDLSSLMDGQGMFYGCPLTSFASDLPSLMDGRWMFGRCLLDAHSVKNIINSIELNPSSGILTLGMGCDDITEDKDLFAQEIGYTNMDSLFAAFQMKNWTIEAQYNGRPISTYGLGRPSENTLPVFVNLEETKDHADYTSEDGSKKYRLVWFHETTGSTDGYTQFNSLEEAVVHFNIKPIERN